MKTVIVTDPCYIIKDGEWDDACKYCSKDNTGVEGNKEFDNFKDFIQNLLRTVSGDQLAVADETGFGDWVNEIGGQKFYADSGMVCVVELTDKLKNYMADNGINLPMGVAYIDVDSSATYEIDTSDRDWSVVKIKSRGETIKSLES